MLIFICCDSWCERHAWDVFKPSYLVPLFQCQKFGQFNKDDPTSFRLSESLSLYPQVISFKSNLAIIMIIMRSPILIHVCWNTLLGKEMGCEHCVNIFLSYTYSLCSTCDGHHSCKFSTTAQMSHPTTGITLSGKTWPSPWSWSSPSSTRTPSTDHQRSASYAQHYHPIINVLCYSLAAE